VPPAGDQTRSLIEIDGCAVRYYWALLEWRPALAVHVRERNLLPTTIAAIRGRSPRSANGAPWRIALTGKHRRDMPMLAAGTRLLAQAMTGLDQDGDSNNGGVIWVNTELQLVWLTCS
jgi:hypothetical protein